MAFTDESDLSESLSSAGSTVPLPSSELGSRAGSEERYAASGLAPSKASQKLERRRRSRFIKSRNSINSSAPTLDIDQEIVSNDHAHLHSHLCGSADACLGPSSPGRLVKSESLPPPDILKESCTPTSTSPHPSTSHGLLPLFEQPVVMQDVRPRRPAQPKKSKQSIKTHRLRSSARGRGAHRAPDPRPLTNGVCTLEQPSNDEDSSLTEQSSSDEAPTNLSGGTADQNLVNGRRSPSVGHEYRGPPTRPARPQPMAPDMPVPLSCPETCTPTCLPSSCDPPSSVVPKCIPGNLSPPALRESSARPLSRTSPKVISSCPRSSLGAVSHVGHPPPHFTSDFLLSQKSVVSNFPRAVNGRHISEESALTPEPEDDRQLPSKCAFVPQSAPTGGFCHTQSDYSNYVATGREDAPSLTSTGREETLCPNDVAPPSNPTPSAILNRPRSLAIVPPPACDPHFARTRPTLDHSSEMPPAPSTPRTGLTCLGPQAAGTSHPAKRLTHSKPQREALEELADEALDGEPIPDDMMEYELEFTDAINGEPCVEGLSEMREVSEAGTSAVDGVPVPESEDLVDELESNNIVDFKSRPDVSPLADTIKSAKSPSIADQESELSVPPSKMTKMATSLEGTYEPEDHARRREGALEAMVKIEIMFAQVRDRLYVERMNDVNRETSAVHQGSHPELNELSKILERKRDARLSLARRMFHFKEIELRKKREAAMGATWSRWHDAKTQLRERMVAETQQQMKRLEREKCRPDLRYNVEVQLLPRPIIPRVNVRWRSRKRARLECDETSEELLAVQFHTAIAKRATVDLSALTAEESLADLAAMRSKHAMTGHLDPINILHAPPTLFCRRTPSAVTQLTPIRKAHAIEEVDFMPKADRENVPSQISTVNPELILSDSCSAKASQIACSSNSCKTTSRSVSHCYRVAEELVDSSRSLLEESEPSTDTLRMDSRSTSLNQHPLRFDRRPTLDAVMAHNTPEHSRGHLKSNSADATLRGLSTICTAGVTTAGHPTSLHHLNPIPRDTSPRNPAPYPPVAITVKYN